MPETGLPIPFVIPPLLPNALRPWIKPMEGTLERWLVPPDLVASVRSAEGSGRGPAFARRLLESLEIRFAVEPRDLARIPARGPAIVVANHPFGLVEGLVLTVLLGAVRPDFRIGANSLLSGVDAMRGHLIPMNPFETRGAMAENCRALRKCLDWLAGGGLLAMFPAGEVAHLSWTEHAVTDPPWKATAARMALRARCPVIPVFFQGANSLPFQLAGVLHPGLRTISLPREFSKMRRKTVQARIGAPIPPALLHGCGGGVRATEYLRSRTFFLRHRRPPASPVSRPARSWEAAGVEAAEDPLAAEVAALPADHKLLESGEFAANPGRRSGNPEDPPGNRPGA
jgi:putative hemolysin